MWKYNILAVDDDPIILTLLVIALEAGGYSVKNVASGGEAIETLHHDTFDMVITDLEMGELDGFAVIRAAKKLNPLAGLIVMTGNKDVSLVTKANRIGVDDYCLKPFSPKEFLERVIKIFENREKKKQASMKIVKSFFRCKQIQARVPLMSHDIR